MIAIGKTTIAWLVLLTGLALTGLLAERGKFYIEQHKSHESAATADFLATRMDERLGAYALILRGGAAMLSGPIEIDRRAWQDYVNALRAGDSVPGVQGIGFARLIPPERLAAHVESVRAEGFPDYRVWPEGARDIYSSIVFLEPFEERNRRAFGYDMFTETIRREAMERARDSGSAALSGMVKLVQETGVADQPGTLMYMPVYARGLPTASVEERRAALIGWVYSPYRMIDLMTGIVGEWRDADRGAFEFDVYDGVAAAEGNLLFSSDGRPGARPAAVNRVIEFHGRDWLLTVRHGSAGGAYDYFPVWGELAAGGAISLLLFLWLYSLSTKEERARRLAQRLTVDIRRREEALREHENRWRSALEGSGLGVWDWRVTEGKVVFSKLWKEMLGYAEDEIGDTLDEWSKRIHPDDRDRVETAVRDYLDGKTKRYVNDHRVRCKDGSYKWIRDRGMAFERDEDGQPLRMVGTHADISGDRALRDALRQTGDELLEAQRIAKIGSWRFDLLTRRTQWTDALFRVFGMEPAPSPPSMAKQRGLFGVATWKTIAASMKQSIVTGAPFTMECEFAAPGGKAGWIVLHAEAERDETGKIVALRGTAADITQRKRAELRSQKMGRLYAALSMSNAAVIHCPTPAELFDSICRIVVRHGAAKLAWIGEIDQATGLIRPSNVYGIGQDYLDGIQVTISADDPRGRGATGTAWRENRAVWIDDFATDPRTTPWRERAARHGWRSSAALPLTRGGVPCAVLTFYADESGMFDEETRQLFSEMATQISFALDKMVSEAERTRVSKTLAEQEARFRALAEQSTVGIYTLDQGTISYINPYGAAIFGYAPSEIVGQAPDILICRESLAQVMEHVRRRESGETNQLRYHFLGQRKDGSTLTVSVDSTTVALDGRNLIMGVLQDISEQVAAERKNREYVARIETMIDSTVNAVSKMVELRDPYTSGHEQRVGELAAAIAGEMGLDSRFQRGLRLAGAVHDVGKLAVPVEILSKPGKLTRPEFDLIKAHAAQGYEMLKSIDSPWPLADVAHQHHERIDGTGYPLGLKGEEIRLEARIITVADVIESMASHRPYRAQLGLDRALEELRQGRGTAYDTAAVDACLRLFCDKGYKLPQ